MAAGLALIGGHALSGLLSALDMMRLARWNQLFLRQASASAFISDQSPPYPARPAAISARFLREASPPVCPLLHGLLQPGVAGRTHAARLRRLGR